MAKVLMINGSRRENGCTFTALTIIAEELKARGIDSEILFVGEKAVNGQIDEIVNEAVELAKEADGFVFGAPVYYASPSGEMIAFMDRFFGVAEDILRFKPAAAITSARRAGTSASLDVLNKYITYNQMPMVTSRYWNMVHGMRAKDIANDPEGVQIMQTIGKNMAWILKSIEAGKAAGVEQPEAEHKIFTNFIR